LPWEDRILATVTVILLHILDLVDVAGSVALVVVTITTTEYSDRVIYKNRFIGVFRK